MLTKSVAIVSKRGYWSRSFFFPAPSNPPYAPATIVATQEREQKDEEPR